MAEKCGAPAAIFSQGMDGVGKARFAHCWRPSVRVSAVGPETDSLAAPFLQLIEALDDAQTEGCQRNVDALLLAFSDRLGLRRVRVDVFYHRHEAC